MAIRVGINGFGRIGRLTFRIMIARGSEFEVVAINDLTDNKMLATLLKYDSTHGRFNGTVEFDEKNLIVNGKTIPVLEEKNPAEVPWKDLGVDVVDREHRHLHQPRRMTARPATIRILVRAPRRSCSALRPTTSADLTVVLGVNDDKLTAAMKCISNASCTTNCLAPVAKVLHESFGIESGLMTTVHAYTNDQHVQDLPHEGSVPCARAAVNIIPTTTGAAKAVGLVIPALKGKLTGIRHARSRTPTGSVVDLTADLAQETSPPRNQRRDQGRRRRPAQGHSLLHRRPDRVDRHHHGPVVVHLRLRPHLRERQHGEGRQLVRQRMGLQLPHRDGLRCVCGSPELTPFDNLHQHPLPSLAVGDGDDDFPPHDLPLVISAGVVFAGAIVQVAAAGGIAAGVEGGEFFQPTFVVGMHTALIVVDEDVGDDVCIAFGKHIA